MKASRSSSQLQFFYFLSPTLRVTRVHIVGMYVPKNSYVLMSFRHRRGVKRFPFHITKKKEERKGMHWLRLDQSPVVRNSLGCIRVLPWTNQLGQEWSKNFREGRHLWITQQIAKWPWGGNQLWESTGHGMANKNPIVWQVSKQRDELVCFSLYDKLVKQPKLNK